MEGKVLHVNVGKTKGVQLLDGKRRVTAKNDLSAICGEKIGCNSSIVCSVKSGFIVVAQMFHTESVLLQRLMSLFVELAWG